MILALTAALVTAPAGNYFPLTPGAEWEYSIQGAALMAPSRFVVKTKAPVDIGGKLVSPMETWIDGELDAVSYYGEHEGFHAVMGSQDGKLLPRPMPFLPIDPKRNQKWEFAGETVLLGGRAAEKSTYVVNGIEKVEALGKKVDAIKITRQGEAHIEGAGMIKTKITDWYAEGIGRVRSEQSMEVRDGAKVVFILIRAEGLTP